MDKTKEQLHELCKAQLISKVEAIEAAIADRREAISNETKSSMGDKYETTREMLQQDINMNMERLQKVKADLDILNNIDPTTALKKVGIGALVKSNSGYFYIAVGIGKVSLNETVYFAVSPSSPIGSAMLSLGVNDSFTFNNKIIKIEIVI